MKIYVASSWRNPLQNKMVEMLRSHGHEVYDFKNPRPGDTGFHWSEIDPKWEGWEPHAFRSGLSHPIAESGFRSDFDAMKWADACVLCLPCGRSAHLEAGWFIGAGKPCFIYLPTHQPCEPELMYKMATAVCVGAQEIVAVTETDGFAFDPNKKINEHFGSAAGATQHGVSVLQGSPTAKAFVDKRKANSRAGKLIRTVRGQMTR